MARPYALCYSARRFFVLSHRDNGHKALCPLSRCGARAERRRRAAKNGTMQETSEDPEEGSVRTREPKDKERRCKEAIKSRRDRVVHEVKFVPFCVEVGGAWGSAARALTLA